MPADGDIKVMQHAGGGRFAEVVLQNQSFGATGPHFVPVWNGTRWAAEQRNLFVRCTTTTTLAGGGSYYCDTSNGPWVATLPAKRPGNSACIALVGSDWHTNPLTVSAPAGVKLRGVAGGKLYLSYAQAKVVLVYVDGTFGWDVFVSADPLQAPVLQMNVGGIIPTWPKMFDLVATTAAVPTTQLFRVTDFDANDKPEFTAAGTGDRVLWNEELGRWEWQNSEELVRGWSATTALLGLWTPVSADTVVLEDADYSPVRFPDETETLREVAEIPASSSATGSRGQMAYSSDFFYLCVNTDTWRRIPLTSW